MTTVDHTDLVPPDEGEPEQETFFVKLADKVSFGMGTPANIGAWLLAVFVWFVLGFTLPSLWTGKGFLPSWFTSTSWNFPLNTVTTLAELYIGFLVGAATNRTERHNAAQADRIELLERNVVELVNENTALTKEVHEHVVPYLREVHTHVEEIKATVCGGPYTDPERDGSATAEGGASSGP